MRKTFLALTLAGFAAAGCFPISADAAEVFVRVAPPRPFVERVAPRPGARHVWVAGYYRWTGRAYVWVPGAWMIPPRPAAVWIAPHWDFVAARGGYVFVAGFWR